MDKYLIKNTTREQREEIVRRSLDCSDSAGCENCSGCGIYGAGDPIDFYMPYINGEKELKELTMSFRSGSMIR